MNKLSSLSVFFPCYNEEKNITILLEQALEFIPQVADKYELIVVNDGSSDNTARVTADLAQDHPEIKLINHQHNRGYGAALQSGFKASQYDWIFFTDGDLQFDLTELKKFLSYIDRYQVVIGYRRRRAEGSLREFNAGLFKLYIDILFRVHVKDIDCAFKLFEAEVIKDLDLFSTGAFISAEFLYKLKKKGVEFKQLPVTHYPRKHGQPTGANIGVIIKGLTDALKLYFKMKFNLQ